MDNASESRDRQEPPVADGLPADAPPAAAWLTDLAGHTRAERARWRGQEQAWSLARLVTFIAAFVVWYPLGEQWLTALAGTGVAVVLFVLAVRRHGAVRAKRELADGLLTVIAESEPRCAGRLTRVRSGDRPPPPERAEAALEPALADGPTWLLTPQERDDLDLYASPAGLFGLLNRTSTPGGERRLSQLLEQPLLDPQHIRHRQEAIRWLAEHHAARLRLLAAGVGQRGRDAELDSLAAALAVTRAEPAGWWWPRLWGWVSFAATVLVTVQVARGQHSWGGLLVPLLLINSAIYAQLRRPLMQVLGPWKRVHRGVAGYLSAARWGAAELPDATNLAQLRGALARAAEPGALPALANWIGWAQAGGFFHALANLFALYDVHVAAGITGIVVPRRDELRAGLTAWAEVEALASVGCFVGETLPAGPACWPELADEACLVIEAGHHPLLPADRAVANDVQLDARTRVWIITGSNMAGKSTHLRLAGLAVLLAQMGSAVPARAMRWHPARLLTDLCVRDDLGKEESYFLAEVRHLRRIVEPGGDPRDVLALIDEPFRGTNSEEQAAASLALVEHLLRAGSLALLATHERQLTQLGDRDGATNYHFREDLSSDGLTFDYILRAGPAPTRNALRVLEQEAFPRPFVADAQRWLANGADPGR